MKFSKAVIDKISSPEEARLAVRASLFDGGDATAELQITVHQTDGDSIVNFWECSRGAWQKLLIPCTMNGMDPHPTMLYGAILVAVGASPSLKSRLKDDLHFSLAVNLLQTRVSGLLLQHSA